MKKNANVSSNGIHVISERDHSENDSSKYRYHLYYDGCIAIEEMSADEMRQIIACFQNALKATEEGGNHE